MQVNVYGLGGTGINITTLLKQLDIEHLKNCAEIKVYQVDSSTSNLSQRRAGQDVYLLDGLDGAGSVRAEVQAAAREFAPDIMLRMPPGDLNILVQSGGGGTGNVLGYYLTELMLGAGHNVINMMVGCYNSRKNVQNTILSLSSYKRLAREVPVALSWFDNVTADGKSISDHLVNQQVVTSILLLAALWSGNHHGMDSRDLCNWLNYPRVTSYEPDVTELVIGKVVPLDKSEVVVALASIYESQEIIEPPVRQVEYVTSGIAMTRPMLAADQALVMPMHYALKQGSLPAVLERLRVAEDQFSKQRAAIRPRSFEIDTDGDGPLM